MSIYNTTLLDDYAADHHNYGYGHGGESSIGGDYYDYGSRIGDPYGDIEGYSGDDGLMYGTAPDLHNLDHPEWGLEDPYYRDLYDDMSFVDHSMPVYDAWGDDSWEEEQYFQQQLEMDRALTESQRLRRWENRLAWEQLDEEQRALRYRELAARNALGAIGLAGGFWGRRFGGMELDLSYLRSVPVQRGLFGASYRSAFARYPRLARRYSPYFSRRRLRAYDSIYPHSHQHRYDTPPISSLAGSGLGLRESELRNRLRIAELRASLTGLDTASRARALDDARRLRAELEAEARLARDIDREERRNDALLGAEQIEAQRQELREEMAEQRGLHRLEATANDLLARPMPGSYGECDPLRTASAGILADDVNADLY
ncbi:hypothetical protein JCM10908_005593 [Rhodotorula pacifica]|uniref:uncharacterized protein n=1 Tax=Rhodotorula pacifica TaxID=1495444 RepID=UPI00317E65A5